MSLGNKFARNVVICGADNALSSHTDNRKINFIVLCEGQTDGINDSTGAPEKALNIKCSKTKAKFFKKPTLFNKLNTDEYNQGLRCYPFMINVSGCNGSYNTLDFYSNRICVLDKT